MQKRFSRYLRCSWCGHWCLARSLPAKSFPMLLQQIQGEIVYTPPPRGVGVHILKPPSGRNLIPPPLKITRKGLSPEFRATRLWRGIKKRASLEIFCLFSCVEGQKGPQKNLRETLVTSDTRVTLVKIPFHTPPTPTRVFAGVAGLGVYKIWPCNKCRQDQHNLDQMQEQPTHQQVNARKRVVRRPSTMIVSLPCLQSMGQNQAIQVITETKAHGHRMVGERNSTQMISISTFWPPTKKTHLGPPEKSCCALFPGKERKHGPT